MKKWKCGVCGYIHEGEAPPEHCPKCGAPREKFSEIPADAAALIDRSRLSNGLHMELHDLCERIKHIAGRGIEDNLDPACVNLFRHAQNAAGVMQGMVKAEIAAHLGKGKWG